MSADLGTDAELIALVAKIRGFDHDNATPLEQHALAQALKVVAQDVCNRHDNVRALECRLKEKIAVAETAGELAGVLSTLRPAPAKRRRWLTFGGK